MRRLAPFFALPLLFVFVALNFTRIVGPFYLACNYDPDYVYLFNGLNLAILEPPSHIDHPGTPLQILMGLAIRLIHLGVPAPQTAAEVIGKAESYLTAASFVIVLAYAAVLTWSGVAVARRTGSPLAGWIVQATPFLLGENFLLLLRVNPEPMLLLLAMALAPILIEETALDGKENWPRRLILSFLVATGVCLKITFLPVFVTVLFLERGRINRLWHAGLVVVWSLIWTVPIWNKFGELWRWFWALALRLGSYGRGPTGFITAKSFFSGLAALFWANTFYALCILAGVFVLIVVASRRDRDPMASRRYVRLLAALVTGGLIQFAISAKNPQSRYLAPSMGLIGMYLAAAALLLARRGPFKILGTSRWSLPLGAGLAAALVLVEQVGLYHGLAADAAGRSELSQVTVNQQQGARIYYYGASSPIYALLFGNSFSGNRYSRIIERLVRSGSCQTYVLNNWTGAFYSLRGRVALEAIIAAGGPIRLQGDRLSEAERNLLPAWTRLSELQQFKDETIYDLNTARLQATGSRP